MQDFCFLAENEASILAALKSVGLTIDDESGVTYALGDYCFAGPGRDGEGVYVVYRATNEQTAVILAARWPRGVSLVAPPSWLPRFGGQWLSPDTAQLRRAAYDRLDATAERLRQGMLHAGTGQMATYQIKKRQATMLLQDVNPTEKEYPDIYNEVGITGATPHEVAMAVLAADERWQVFARAIEKARLAGKLAVRAAADGPDIEAAEAAVVWPSADAQAE